MNKKRLAILLLIAVAVWLAIVCSALRDVFQGAWR